MTLDERIQALRYSIELLHAFQLETDQKIRQLATIAKQNEERAAQVLDIFDRLDPA